MTNVFPCANQQDDDSSDHEGWRGWGGRGWGWRGRGWRGGWGGGVWNGDYPYYDCPIGSHYDSAMNNCVVDQKIVDPPTNPNPQVKSEAPATNQTNHTNNKGILIIISLLSFIILLIVIFIFYTYSKR